MDDKELVEVWRSEFSESYGKGIMDGTININCCKETAWAAFYVIKRSQPSVVLPSNAEINHLAVDTAGEYDWNTIEAKEKYMNAFTDGALMICDDIARNITAAGIKYTVRG